MTLSVDVFGLFTTSLRKFTGQLLVSVAATICATAIYSHIVSEPAAPLAPPEVSSAAMSLRAAGGVIDGKTLAYYPEHLAALDSLARFRPLSAQRTAELAAGEKVTHLASVSDAAKPRRVDSAETLASHRPVTVAQVTVLPPRRPTAPASAPLAVAEITPPPRNAKIWGMELPHFVPTGAAVMDKLVSMKERIGGLIHVSSR